MSEEEVLEALETIKSTLLGTAHRFFSCYADCEDAVQECFYKSVERTGIYSESRVFQNVGDTHPC